jgi:hypothetical protein
MDFGEFAALLSGVLTTVAPPYLVPGSAHQPESHLHPPGRQNIVSTRVSQQPPKEAEARDVLLRHRFVYPRDSSQLSFTDAESRRPSCAPVRQKSIESFCKRRPSRDDRI